MKAFTGVWSIAFAFSNRGAVRHNSQNGLTPNLAPKPTYLFSCTAPAEDVLHESQLSSDVLSELGPFLSATPSNLLRLVENEDGIRGIYLNYAVKKGGVVLKIPLTSCLRDDAPPAWFQPNNGENGSISFNPSDWATRLAASLVDLKLSQDNNNNHPTTPRSEGMHKWLDMLPNPDELRASLPIHWNEEVLLSARCSALDLSVDASYFARAQAVADLMEGLTQVKPEKSTTELQQLCQDALDVIQTRSCRAEFHEMDDAVWGPPLRVLAPIFDFINHGSCATRNCMFQAEREIDTDYLVVRTRRDVRANEEALIDYGDSARPAWKCLSSYGFVPRPKLASGQEEKYDMQREEEEQAEVWLDGVRYEVGPSIVPFEMVEAVAESLKAESLENDKEEELFMTPEIALTLAKRVSEVSFQLLVEPTGAEASKDDISKTLAQALRWSHHHTLLACAIGLRDWVVDSESW